MVVDDWADVAVVVVDFYSCFDLRCFVVVADLPKAVAVDVSCLVVDSLLMAAVAVAVLVVVLVVVDLIEEPKDLRGQRAEERALNWPRPGWSVPIETELAGFDIDQHLDYCFVH